MAAGYAIPEELKEQAKALYLQGITTSDISHEIGVPYGAIRTWIKRGKWGSLRSATQLKVGPLKQKAVTRSISFVGSLGRTPAVSASRLRGVLSKEVEAQVTVLEQNPPNSLLELKNTPDREGRASVVKRLVDSAAILEDWESQRTPGIVVMTEASTPADELRSTQEVAAIDVQSESAPDPAEEAIRALQEE